MSSMPQITITGMKIGKFDIPVPYGLSELLNDAGAWGIRKQESNNKRYERTIERRGENIVTILTFRG